MKKVLLSFLITLGITLGGCLVNYLYYQANGCLLLAYKMWGGEITHEMGFGWEYVHIYAMTPDERDALWLELEKKFRPHICLEGMPYLEKGTRWQYQMHIYETPFYYIDYVLAPTAAFNFLLASQKDYDDAFARYLRLSKQGGEKLWTDLLEEAGFTPPFVPGALGTLAGEVEALLEKIKV